MIFAAAFLKLIKLVYKRKESPVRVNVRGVEISMVCDNITVNGKGHLCFDGQDTVELAQKYGLTQQRVYAILKAERARRGSGQLRFPGL